MKVCEWCDNEVTSKDPYETYCKTCNDEIDNQNDAIRCQLENDMP